MSDESEYGRQKITDATVVPPDGGTGLAQVMNEAHFVGAGLTRSTLPRRTLPPRRESETFEVTFWKLPWLVSVGFYEDRVTPGEVFVTGAKSGTDVEATAHDAAILLSLAMQHGVPLTTIDAALIKNSDGSPGSLIGAVVKQLRGR